MCVIFHQALTVHRLTGVQVEAAKQYKTALARAQTGAVPTQVKKTLFMLAGSSYYSRGSTATGGVRKPVRYNPARQRIGVLLFSRFRSVCCHFRALHTQSLYLSRIYIQLCVVYMCVLGQYFHHFRHIFAKN